MIEPEFITDPAERQFLDMMRQIPEKERDLVICWLMLIKSGNQAAKDLAAQADQNPNWNELISGIKRLPI